MFPVVSDRDVFNKKKLIEPFKKVNRKTIQEIHEDKKKKKTAIKLKNNNNC